MNRSTPLCFSLSALILLAFAIAVLRMAQSDAMFESRYFDRTTIIFAPVLDGDFIEQHREDVELVSSHRAALMAHSTGSSQRCFGRE
jgi:hypothetical protein